MEIWRNPENNNKMEAKHNVVQRPTQTTLSWQNQEWSQDFWVEELRVETVKWIEVAVAAMDPNGLEDVEEGKNENVSK